LQGFSAFGMFAKWRIIMVHIAGLGAGFGFLAQTASALKRTPAALGVDRAGKRSGLIGKSRAWIQHAAAARFYGSP
jgi:hypothetical protein